MVNRADRWKVTPATLKAGPVTTSICGKGTFCLPLGKSSGFQLLRNSVGSLYPTRTSSWRKTEMPIAVIRGASRGAPRRGR